jgi:hypothetical protein
MFSLGRTARTLAPACARMVHIEASMAKKVTFSSHFCSDEIE